MINAILERQFEIPCTEAEVLDTDEKKENCFNLYRVAWQQSLLSNDGHRLICWFESLDLESARIALRSIGADVRVLWSAEVRDAPGTDPTAIERANVVVERSFEKAVELDELQAIEDAGADDPEMRRVRFLRALLSRDRRRMLCLYEAPDSESIRDAQREARLPFDTVWPFRLYRPIG